MTKSAIAPGDKSGEAIKLDVIFDDLLVFAHPKIGEIFFSIAGGIDRAEGLGELTDKLVVVVGPLRKIMRIIDAETRLEPIKCGAL